MDKQRLKARLRAFTIWQKLGFLPWSKKKIDKTKNGDFYRGAFDSIPFLNEDAKRTFVHLLLRPGYMIRDYIKGQHERYLAPLTSLIIFYAFFALVSSVVNPDYSWEKNNGRTSDRTVKVDFGEPEDVADSLDLTETQRTARDKAMNVSRLFLLLSLDKHPEMVDSPAKASLAALESSMRGQGVYLFLSQFIFLWLGMFLALHRRGMGLSACAAAAAYILCQFCFFMFFFLFLANKKGEIGLGLSCVLMMIDYRQLFGVGWKKSFRLTVKTGIFYAVVFMVTVLLLTGLVFLFTK